MEAKPASSESIFPECWSDDVRMNSLFAPFRKRSVNPLDWDSKLKFWKSLIETWCQKNRQPVFTVAEITKAFERNGRRALCLPDVVIEIIRSGEACKACDFERGNAGGAYSGEPGSWLGWAVGLAKKPMSWAVGRLWGDQSSAPSELDPEEPIVLLSVLKKISDSLVENSTGELTDLAEMQKTEKSKENLRLAVLMLERRGLAQMTQCGQRTLVKVSPDSDVVTAKASTGAAAVAPISEVERSAFVLHKDEVALQKNIEKLEEEKQRLQEEARMYVRKGMRQLAKSSLKKRHELEKCIEKRVTALENVQSLLHRVKEAETDGQVLESYKMGVAALKNTFKEAGLTEDNIETTRNELEEVLDLHSDLTSTLSDLGKSVMPEVEGEEDLEAELAELLSQPEPEAEPAAQPAKTKNEPSPLKWGDDIERRLKTLTVEDLPSPPDDPLVTPPSVKVKSKVIVPDLL
ncbi:charged multivesicular body protein 7 [Ischnura elegans]|uniref:charged multivesicular body protein 7 n=1 Tax=Ischnura elegans TaxID=197161 RepID=UPI001ED882AA|nr:charged multivesicular body protein 7 [Ischnura elegans]